MSKNQNDKLNIPIKDEYWQNIINWALNIIEQEARSYPCFGLVSEKNSGCHNDMDINTFLLSKNTFAFYFQDILSLIYKKEKLDFSKLRKLGINQEKRMYLATKNINTHKGLIFSFGIIFYCLSFCFYHKIKITNLQKIIKKMVKPLKLDFKQSQETVGYKIYDAYNIKGARGIAISGYDVVFKKGLTFLKKYQIKYDLDYNQQVLMLLVFYLAKINDTTLINKIGYNQNLQVKKQAKIWIKILIKKGWNEFYQRILANNEIYLKNNVSPGGCADLCVITLFLSKFI